MVTPLTICMQNHSGGDIVAVGERFLFPHLLGSRSPPPPLRTAPLSKSEFGKKRTDRVQRINDRGGSNQYGSTLQWFTGRGQSGDHTCSVIIVVGPISMAVRCNGLQGEDRAVTIPVASSSWWVQSVRCNGLQGEDRAVTIPVASSSWWVQSVRQYAAMVYRAKTEQ